MALYPELSTEDSRGTVATAAVPTAVVPTTPTEPSANSGRSANPDRRGVLAPAALLVATIAGFALLMSMVTAPGAPAAGHAHPGPVAADFVAISAAPAELPAPRSGPAASTGALTSRCGRNTDGHRNSDNFITAPGRSNGAHHVHDYVGNTSTYGGSTDQSLAAAPTTCEQGDKSVYFWPVLRDIRHAGEDADRPGGGMDGNLGHILVPVRVALDFLGNRQAKVQPMPRFLRIVTGDAKAVTKGPDARARALWSCSGTPGRASSTHYPICPAGQQVQRVGEFPSCWNGADTDSEDHRTHVTFPDEVTGACPTGTMPIPRLRITLSYDVPPGRSFAIDSFPDQQRNAATDHFDFENVMPASLMSRVVDCVNSGRTC
jgi:hypothetical protein